MIHYQSAQGAPRDKFTYVMPQGDIHTVDMQSALTVNSTESYSAACMAGLGIIQVPVIGVREALRTHRRNLAMRVQVFMDWMSEVIRKQYVE